MRILVAGDFRYSLHQEAWCRALREIGHEVGEFRIWPYIKTVVDKAQQRFVFGPLLNRINRDLVTRAQEFRPEVIVCYRAVHVYPETVDELRARTGATLVCYTNDFVFGALGGKAYFRLFKKAIPCYNLHLVYGEHYLEPYREAGAKKAVVLRSHYLPWLHRRLDPSEFDGRQCDIGFFGHSESDRRLELMDALMRSVKAQYSLRGANWDKYGRGRAWEGMDRPFVPDEEYVKCLNGAKIALAFFSAANGDTYTRRCFEIPACGTFMLSCRTPTTLSLYTEGKEAVFFSSSDELVDKARFYLGHDAARRTIAEAGHRRCTTSGYDVHSRMREWLKLIQ